MSRPATFSEVIALWPTAVELGRDIDVKEVTVRAWRARGIPAEYWKDIAAAACRHAASDQKFDDVTVDLLAEIAAREAGRPPTSSQIGPVPTPSLVE